MLWQLFLILCLLEIFIFFGELSSDLNFFADGSPDRGVDTGASSYSRGVTLRLEKLQLLIGCR